MQETYTYVLAMLSLVMAASLTVRSRSVNKYKNRYYITAVMINIVILICEICKQVAETRELQGLARVAAAVVFILAPFLPYFIVLVNLKRWGKLERIWMIPAVVVTLLSIVSIWTEWLFRVDEHGKISYGPAFAISVLVFGAYFVYALKTAWLEYRDADIHEKVYLISVFALTLVGVICQARSQNGGYLWPAVALTLLMYYTLVLELNGKYDVLTGVRNRVAYDACKSALSPDRDYVVIVVDINGLKTINDNYGHDEGDKLIMDAADVLKSSFVSSGMVFRIGGDEFCIICDNGSRESMRIGIWMMEQALEKVNLRRERPLTMAVGAEMHESGDVREFHEVFRCADIKMYENKQEFYKKNNLKKR